ncbi:MAG: hypothetical protein DYG92_02035 [Leptolyngbya sp. PLA1]|nr:hypothetical protein [Leptolyngbya sp. PLA1]
MSTPAPIRPAFVPTPPPRSWAVRHWVLLVILGVLVVLLLAGGGVTWFVFQIFAMLRSHPAAQQGVAIAQADPQVIAAIGQPITLGPIAGGNIGVRNGVQVADLQLSLRGPKSKGTLWLRATASGTTWTFDRLEFSPVGGRMFDVARPSAPAPTVLPAPTGPG